LRTASGFHIAGAEYYVDNLPWVAGASAVPMAAADGAFNAGTEGVNASINTTGWSAGKHIVFVRGRDANNNWGAFSAVYITIDPNASTAPVAAFDFTTSGLSVNFTDRSTDNGSITARSWSFGDGGTSTATNPTHTYAAAGAYNVTLTVTDNEGKTGSISKAVGVSDDGVPVLSNGAVVSSLSGARRSWRYYKVNVPAGARNLSISTSGGSGDVDLYTQLGQRPTTTSNNCARESSTNSETCSFATPAAGWTYIGIYGYRAYSGVTLRVTFTP
jgi:PKD repeat protein